MVIEPIKPEPGIAVKFLYDGCCNRSHPGQRRGEIGVIVEVGKGFSSPGMFELLIETGEGRYWHQSECVSLFQPTPPKPIFFILADGRSYRIQSINWSRPYEGERGHPETPILHFGDRIGGPENRADGDDAVRLYRELTGQEWPFLEKTK